MPSVLLFSQQSSPHSHPSTHPLQITSTPLHPSYFSNYSLQIISFIPSPQHHHLHTFLSTKCHKTTLPAIPFQQPCPHLTHISPSLNFLPTIPWTNPTRSFYPPTTTSPSRDLLQTNNPQNSHRIISFEIEYRLHKIAKN